MNWYFTGHTSYKQYLLVFLHYLVFYNPLTCISMEHFDKISQKCFKGQIRFCPLEHLILGQKSFFHFLFV